MSRADDLAPLFNQGGGDDVGIRQGTVISWASDGTNAIDVGGTRLTNLPALTLGGFVDLQPGDVVLLLRRGLSFCVLGRVKLPGPPDPSRQVIDFDSDSAEGNDFSITTTPTTRASFSFPAPSWANEASVMVIQQAVGINNGTSVQDYLTIQPFVNGTGLKGMFGGAGNGGGSGFATAGGAITLAGPFTVPILVEGKVWAANASWGADPSNSTAISAIVMYRRTS